MQNTGRHSLRLQLAAFVFVRLVFNTAVRMVYPFLPAFQRGLGVPMSSITLALTMRQSMGALAPFFGSLSDSHGRKVGMLTGVLLFTGGASLVVLWPGYVTFVLALVLTISGNFILIPSMQAYLGDRVAYERRGLVLAVAEFSWSLSFILMMPLVGWLLAGYGWQSAFWLLAGAGTLMFVLLAWLLPRDRRPDGAQRNLWRNLRVILASPPAVFGLLIGVSISAANEMINVVFGLWLEQAFALQVTALGLASVVIGLAELGGEGLVGALTDRLGKPRAIAIGITINSFSALALALVGRTPALALGSLFLFYLSFEFTLVSAIPLMTEVLPAVRGTLMATFIGSQSVGRGLADLLAPLPYAWGLRQSWLPGPAANAGVLVNALVLVVFNLLAVWALRSLQRSANGRF